MIDKSKLNMPGVSFDGKHTWLDYGLFMEGSPSIGMPEVQSTLIQIPGRDGLLRLSAAVDGTVHYYNRSFTASFFPNDRAAFVDTVSVLAAAIHGKFVKMVPDCDSEFFFEGEFYVEPDYENGSITVSGSLNPFKVHIKKGDKRL